MASWRDVRQLALALPGTSEEDLGRAQIRLPKISRKSLKDVLVEAWLARASKRAVTAFLQTREGSKPRGKGLK
jgi:hypothetical protein